MDLDKDIEVWVGVSREVRDFVARLSLAMPDYEVVSVAVGQTSSGSRNGTIAGIPFQTAQALAPGGITFTVRPKKERF